MEKINVGYYLKPHVWIGVKANEENATELAFVEENISSGIDLGVQRQGLVLASIDTTEIPDYRKSDAVNLLRSESASFVLNFFNALSFSLYEAHLKKHKGSFQSVPQEILLEDLYLWPGDHKSINEINRIQPSPICSGEFDTFQEGVSKLRKTVGHLDQEDLKFRIEISDDIFSQYLDKELLSPNVLKLFSLINRGIVSIRGASFDMALINIWTVIELIMKEIWSAFLNGKDLPRKRKEFLNGRDITAAIISENLNLHGVICGSLYEKISEARKARNKLMHELKAIDPAVCYSAFEAVKELINIQYSIKVSHNGSFFMGDIKFGQVR